MTAEETTKQVRTFNEIVRRNTTVGQYSAIVSDDCDETDNEHDHDTACLKDGTCDQWRGIMTVGVE